jgi:hypothetical protein
LPAPHLTCSYNVTIASVLGGATTVSPGSLDGIDQDAANSGSWRRRCEFAAAFQCCFVLLHHRDLKHAPAAEFWKNESTRKLTETTPALATFSGASFDCVFFVGGFGTMWDFPQSADVARVASEACAAPLGSALPPLRARLRI